MGRGIIDSIANDEGAHIEDQEETVFYALALKLVSYSTPKPASFLMSFDSVAVSTPDYTLTNFGLDC